MWMFNMGGNDQEANNLNVDVVIGTINFNYPILGYYSTHKWGVNAEDVKMILGLGKFGYKLCKFCVLRESKLISLSIQNTEGGLIIQFYDLLSFLMTYVHDNVISCLKWKVFS